MNDYKLNQGTRSYAEPAVSYFDSILEAGEKTVMAMVSSATAIALALVSALATSSRGSENPLKSD